MGIIILKILAILVPLLISIAYLTLAERKVLGYIQCRKGPNVVGVYGLLQPLADGLKLFIKEIIIPNHANIFIYIMAPILSLTLAFMAWGVIPYGQGIVFSDLGIGILYLFAVSSISVYAILMSGWSSNSKYAFLGAIRAAAQMISYEVSIGLIIISVVLCVGSLNLTEIVLTQKPIWFIIPLFPAAIMFFVSALAETNRVPFDLTEGESELVSGYNVEYSSMSFALFFLAEYAHIILMSTFGVILFLGGWMVTSAPWLNHANIFILSPILGLKVSIIIFLFIWVRASYPRIRYDQLMVLLWKSYLPLSLAFVVLVSGILIGFNALPPY
uniref:NADH-ubiquinone oxidoreductase chain 1 n=2 Tax=Spongillidae TaxID=6050 RepID=G8Z440_9METZ|nr:NADH dehydrogenase subunit 1 [Eunapius subterraneus]ACY35561.1 NADH dehydrogenase subunit 1 [Eunapius subterraneus]AEK94598.1 NADH dehydrogenase subunit 1 [Ephydatia fluviatilis]